MEEFKKMTIWRATHKPVCWVQYVDDTSVFWPHGHEKFFLEYLNNARSKYPARPGGGKRRPLSLDGLDIYRRPDGSLGSTPISA
jgi:hypothetical protein